MAYDDPYADHLLECFESLVDICHSKTLHDSELNQFQARLDITEIENFKLAVELNANGYIEHTVQDENFIREIEKLLDRGLKDQVNIFPFLEGC